MGQEITFLPSGGIVNPDVNFYAKASKDSEIRLFERRENKTLQVMLYNAHELEHSSELALGHIKTQAVRGILTQVRHYFLPSSSYADLSA
jgi:hypothetical protein